jgi:hypothetical protein
LLDPFGWASIFGFWVIALMVQASFGSPQSVRITQPADGSVYSFGNFMQTILVEAVAEGRWGGGLFLANGEPRDTLSPEPELSTSAQTVFRHRWHLPSAGSFDLTIMLTNGNGSVLSPPVHIEVRPEPTSIHFVAPQNDTSITLGTTIELAASAPPEVSSLIFSWGGHIVAQGVRETDDGVFRAAWTPDANPYPYEILAIGRRASDSAIAVSAPISITVRPEVRIEATSPSELTLAVRRSERMKFTIESSDSLGGQWQRVGEARTNSTTVDVSLTLSDLDEAGRRFYRVRATPR